MTDNPTIYYIAALLFLAVLALWLLVYCWQSL